MQSCYNCGKLLLGKKVFGQIGSAMYNFCSEKCRMATWTKIGVKGNDSMDFSESDFNSGSSANYSQKKDTGSKSGSTSALIVEGAEYSYSAHTNRVTMKIKSLQNKSGGKTGSLRFELFMSKSGPFEGGAKPQGFTLAVSSVYEPLRINSAYSNITSTVLASEEKKSGTYQPVILVKELNEDGTWHIAAWANFPGKDKLL